MPPPTLLPGGSTACTNLLRMWGKEWRGRRILAHCDNEAAVHMLASRSSRDTQLNHLLRCLFFIEAEFNFALSGTHIAGVDNHLADDLSRDKFLVFSLNYHRPTPYQRPSPSPSRRLYWTLMPHGHRPARYNSLSILSRWVSLIHKENISSSYKAFSVVL